MANTKKTNTSAKTGKTRSSSASKGSSKRKKKNSSDDTMKFLMVLVIAVIAIALIFFMQPKDGNEGELTGTPTPTAAVSDPVTPENPDNQNTPAAPTEAPATPVPTKEPEKTPEPTATPTPTNTPTPTPTPVLSAEEALTKVKGKIDTKTYSVQLINDHLRVGNGEYYQFGAIKGQEFEYPFIVVGKMDGVLYFYDSADETVFDFTSFPVKQEVTPAPTEAPKATGDLSAEEAYKVLCTYSKESLHIAKEVKEYDAEYGSELTLVYGENCYRINLSEVSGGKVRNRGEFYVSVDGTKCYYIDSDTNEFVLAQK